MTTAAIVTRKNEATRWAKPAPPEDAKRCTGCGIFIFDNMVEATMCQVPYWTTINHAVGELCIGCAGGDKSLDHLLTLVWRIERKETHMPKSIKQNNGLFLEMETGVNAPAASGRGSVNYSPLEGAVFNLSLDSQGASEWVRFKFAEHRLALNANSWLLNRFKTVYRKRGHDLHRRIVKNDDGTAWLYVQRVKLEEA